MRFVMRACLSVGARWLGVCCAVVGLALPVAAQSTRVELVTGDYPPFSSEEAPAMGVLSEVVMAAFKEVVTAPNKLALPSI